MFEHHSKLGMREWLVFVRLRLSGKRLNISESGRRTALTSSIFFVPSPTIMASELKHEQDQFKPKFSMEAFFAKDSQSAD